MKTCRVCRRIHAQAFTVPESALPQDRVTPSRAFSCLGVDYFGPFLTSDRQKVYGLLFTCASVRAVILEAVPNQSFETFQNAFRRLESRVGRVETVISDNAKVFRKAGSFYRSRLTWKFIPSRSPHFGGFYERLVASVKSCLRKAIGTSTLSFDAFNTLLHEVEGVLNRRPLSYVSDDPSLPLPIRPIDFLHPDVPVGQDFCKEELTKSFKKSKVALDSFWNRWKNEYLNGLRLWRRSSSIKCVPSVGQVVIVHTSSTKNKMLFPLGVIQSLVYGTDGKIRSAYVRMASGTLHRSIHLLYPLEAPPANASSQSRLESDVSCLPGASKWPAVMEPAVSSNISSPLKSSSTSSNVSRFGRRIKPVIRY